MTTPDVRRILVAIDFSPSAALALEWARTLARACGAEVTLLHVVDLGATWVPLSGPAVFPAPVPAEAAKEVGELAQASLDALAPGAPEVTQRIVRTGHPREAIAAAAREVGADLIVVGSHGRRGVSQLFMGSVAEHVVRHAPVPVLVVRNHDLTA
jgi:nucleotide-binding universal stress UspA family protein